LFIINPAAGRGRTQKILPYLKTLLEEKKIQCEFRFTSRSGEATQIAKEAAAMGVVYAVSVGGDGTTHEVANGLIGSSTVLGITPVREAGTTFQKPSAYLLNSRERLKRWQMASGAALMSAC